ncbi:ATP-binding protein [Streptomyces sp. DH10]|uniref:ATP-binding protein n=1 Tax=Streptomyces sp. DH10 TaxID=3040121 RepID=UPI002442F6CB|nr:ATP-binding protein [Streptomyces sp. DH10]MDG9709604.1 ATP-binding protein [Streptomyces sp. DH10]
MTSKPEGKADGVGRRLTSAFAVTTCLILLVGVGALIGAFLEKATQDQIIDRVQPALMANTHLHNQAAHMQRSMRGYLLTGDRALLADYRRARAGYPAILVDARRHTAGDTERNLNRQDQQLQAYLRVGDQQAKAAPRSEQAAGLTREGNRRFEAFEATNHRLETQLVSEAKRLQQRADTIVTAGAAGLGALLLAALALALYTARRTTRALVVPLRSVGETLGRLSAGEHDVRVAESGPAEIRSVARLVNELADESGRLRGIEEERYRLSETVRQLGLRIRERLDVGDVLNAACTGMGEGLDADYVFTLLMRDSGSEVVPVARAWSARDGLLPEERQQALPPIPAEVLREHYREGTTWAVPDLPRYLTQMTPVPGAPGSFARVGLPAANRAAATELGLHSIVVVPMGIGQEPIGAVCLARTRPEQPWRPVETEMAEAMAAGVARALHTSKLYEKETRLVEELRALDRTKSDFISTVSHELRTPLTSITGYLQLLRDEDVGPITEEQQHMLDIVSRNAQRLRTLIEDLLTLSRIESGKYTSRKAPVDLRHMVTAAIDAMHPAAEAASVRLHADCPEQPLVCEADSDQIDRVLMNLLSNAVKFTPAGGRVHLQAAAQDGHAVLTVSDTGIGIPEAEQHHLFTRFFRASNATDQAIPGTGLGLTIVDTIITNHGGTTHLQSTEGQGTTITATLPLATRDSPTPPLEG